MAEHSSIGPTIRELIGFSLPIIAGNISHNLIGMGDMIVASRYSTQALAAIGLANGLMNPIMVIGIGLLIGIAPLLSQKRGEGHSQHGYLYFGLLYALAISAFIQMIVILVTQTVNWWGFDPPLIPIVKEYIFLFQWSIPGAFLFQVMKEILQAREDVVTANLIAMFSVGVNIILNIILVFGYGGISAMGIKGLAIASVLSRWLMAMALFFYFIIRYQESWNPQWSFIRDVFHLSLPISSAIFAEVSFFGLTTLLIGKIGTLQIAAHNIVLMICSFTFMVPLAINNAVAVKVGYAFGQKNIPWILLYQKSSLVVSLIFMGCMAMVFCFFQIPILSLFSSDPQLIEIARSLLLVGAVFQVMDGTQVTMAGVLRGIGITKPVFILILLTYWGFSLPLGYYLAISLNWNAMGYWVGIALGLGLVAIGLLLIFRRQIKCLNLLFTSSKTEIAVP